MLKPLWKHVVCCARSPCDQSETDATGVSGASLPGLATKYSGKTEGRVAPRVGFEPTTSRLTVGCSTTELPRNTSSREGGRYSSASQPHATGNIRLAVIPIDDPHDARIAAFRDIRERDLTGRQGLFVAEGEVVLRVLASP